MTENYERKKAIQTFRKIGNWLSEEKKKRLREFSENTKDRYTSKRVDEIYETLAEYRGAFTTVAMDWELFDIDPYDIDFDTLFQLAEENERAKRHIKKLDSRDSEQGFDQAEDTNKGEPNAQIDDNPEY